MKLNEIDGSSTDPFTIKSNGDIFYKGHFVENYKTAGQFAGCDDEEDVLDMLPDVVIGHRGIDYINNDSDLAYIDELAHNIVVGPPYVIGEYLYKATNNIESPQVPGFMADEESVQQYLPGGARNRDYGGGQLIRAKIGRIDKISEPELIDSANFGRLLLLPGTPSILDFGENDGILVLQRLAVELIKLG